MKRKEMKGHGQELILLIIFILIPFLEVKKGNAFLLVFDLMGRNMIRFPIIKLLSASKH